MKALTVRQPWAWAIIHGGMTVENRDWRASHPGLKVRGRVLIHASRHMMRFECKVFDNDAPIDLVRPTMSQLLHGGFIGSVEVVDVLTKKNIESANPVDKVWFAGPVGLLLRNPRPLSVPIVPFKSPNSMGFYDVPDDMVDQWRPLGEIVKGLVDKMEPGHDAQAP